MSGATGGYWEDFEVGARYPTTSRTITEEDHLQFCKLVGYDVPLFLDEAYAKNTPYGGRICPSHLTMSFSTAMTGRLFAGTVLALLAVERGKFFGPVPGTVARPRHGGRAAPSLQVAVGQIRRKRRQTNGYIFCTGAVRRGVADSLARPGDDRLPRPYVEHAGRMLDPHTSP